MHKVIRERRDTISYIIDKWASDLSLYALNEKAYKINLNLLNEHFEIMFKDLDVDIILYARKALFDLSSYHFSDIPTNYYVFFDTLYTACDFEYKLIQQEIKKEKQKRKYKHSQIMLN